MQPALRNTIERRAATKVAMAVGTAVAAVLAAGVFMALRGDTWGERGSGLSDRFEYDIQAFQKVDPALIGYCEAARFALSVKDPRAVAVGPDGELFVAGDRTVLVLDGNGQSKREIALEGEPTAIAVAGRTHAEPGRIYLGLGDHVEVYTQDGKRAATWPKASPRAAITSIAMSEHDVFVADAGARVVLRCDVEGKILGRIGGRDEARHVPGIVIPSPYFDVAWGSDGLLRVANPGGHRIEAYTVDGDLEQAWGKGSLAIEGFCGCCNPANFAMFDDGRFVTAEKGLPRVKVYGADGKFQCVVVPPDALLPTATSPAETRTEHKLKVVDVAVDREGRVLVLEPMSRTLRRYETKPAGTPTVTKDSAASKSS